VFPAERVGAAGNAFDGKVYGTDPTKPVGAIKQAWEAAKRRTRRQCPNCATGMLVDHQKPKTGHFCASCNFEVADLPPGLTRVRFHDLRHTAVSRMIAARVPLPLIAKIVGWSAGTMAKMAARYGHFALEELRGAVEAMSQPQNSIDQGSPRNPPQLNDETSTERAN
jgi:integrase